jgi:hypothetical protein
VTYHVGENKVSHTGYMDAVGVRREAAYPSVETERLDGFRQLLSDLERFAENFLEGDGEILRGGAKGESERAAKESVVAMAGAVGDTRARQEAATAFKKGDWLRVVQLLESLQYPDLMTTSDQKRLEIARRRSAAG